MASITSTATGNWAAGGTWVGGVAPGNGDTAIIANGHTVTIAAATSVTVGDSVNPGTPAIQTAVATNGTGVLIVGAGATLTIKGMVIQGNTTWQVNTSAVVNFAHATTDLEWRIGDGTTTNAVLTFAGGTGANRITVQSTLAAKGYFTGVTFNNAGKIQATGVQFTSIGSSTKAFLKADNFTGTTYASWFDDCLFTSCGKFNFSNNYLPAGATLRFRRTSIFSSASSDGKAVDLLLGTGTQSGVVFDRVRCKGQIFMLAQTAATTGVDWDDVLIDGTTTVLPLDCSTTPPGGTFDLVMLNNPVTASGSPSRLMNGTITRLLSHRQGGVANSHAMTIDLASATTIVGGLFEFSGSASEDGDQLQLTNSPATNLTLQVADIVAPPVAGVGAGAFFNISVAGANNARVTIERNTTYVSGTAGAGAVITENTSGGAGVFVAIQDNCWYRDTSGSGYGVFQVNGTLTNGTFTNVDYNAKVNLTTDGYQPADVAFASPSPPGPHDITTAPAFVDRTRNLLTWGQSITPSLTTRQQVVDELMKRNDDAGWNAGFTLLAYYTWVRDGFAPTDAAYGISGHAGGRIGAMPVVAVGPGLSYLDFLASDAPNAVVLAEIQPAEQLGPFTLESGVVYKVAWPKAVQTSLSPGGLYRRLDEVREGDGSYTPVASVAACQALAGSYFYDPSVDLIYVHTSSGISANAYSFFGAWFTIFLATTTVNLDGQPTYQPLVSGLPTLESEMPDPLFGATIASTGDLAISNTDGVFDQLSKRWIWRNKLVTFRLGGPSVPFDQFATIATMRINGLNVDDQSLVLQLEDTSAVLNQTLPYDSWTAVGTDGRTSAPKPLVFGTVADCPCVFLGHDTIGNRDLWAGYDFDLNNVTVLSVSAVQRETGVAVPLILFTHYNIEVTSGLIRVTDATYFSSAGFDIIATLQETHIATFGSIAHRLLNRANESDENIDLAAFAAADLAAPQLLARYVNVPIPAADLMRELEQSVLGQVYRGIDGRWTCRVLDPSLPASVSLVDADFASWSAVGEFSAVLNTVRVRYGYHPFGDVWLTTSASSSDVEFGAETFDSHQVDTWLPTLEDAGVLASRLLFWYSAVPANIATEQRGLTLMESQVGDLVSVTRSRAPLARTGKYEGQLLRILKLTKSLGVPSVSCVLGDLGGHADQIARLADFTLDWSTATAEQRAVYGFLADSNGYIDSTDVTTRNLKVVV